MYGLMSGWVHAYPCVLACGFWFFLCWFVRPSRGNEPTLTPSTIINPPTSTQTVTGKTVAENLKDLPGLSAGQEIILPIEKPIKPSGHLQILYGNLAPEGSVAKITGKEGERFEGVAAVYDDEEDMLAALERKDIKPGMVRFVKRGGGGGRTGGIRGRLRRAWMGACIQCLHCMT